MGEALISRPSKKENINIVQETGTSTTDVMSQNASTNSFAAKIHSHSVSDLNSGVLPVWQGGTGQSSLNSGQILLGNGTNSIASTNMLQVWQGGTGQTNLPAGAILLGNGTNGITSTYTLPIDRGGTGATDAGWALSNLGLPKEAGNWTPSINAAGVSYSNRVGFYYRIDIMIYIFCYITMNITNAGSEYARVDGLPFAANTGMKAGFNLIDTGNLNMIPDSGSTPHARFANSWGGAGINIYTADGSTAQRWSNGDGKYLVFSGWYVKA